MQEREKRIFGMLAGCALGDAMGMFSEGMDAKTIRSFLPFCEKDVLGRLFKVSLLCLPTHHTPVAIAGASIVAALSSYALQGGCDMEDMWGLAERVCSHWKAYDLAAELDDIREYMIRHEKAEILRYLEKKGTGIETIRTIPAVLTLLELSGPDPYECAVLAASLGGDTDTIGAISCSICGTVHPDIDETLVSVLEQVNGIVFSAYARNLAKYGSS